METSLIELNILKNTIENKDLKALEMIPAKKEYIFKEANCIVVWESIEKYYGKFDGIPDYEYLAELYKNNKQEDVIDTLSEIEKCNVIDSRVEPLIELLLQQYAKDTIERTLTLYRNQVKTKGVDKVYDTLEELNESIQNIKNQTSVNEVTQGLVYGEDSYNSFINDYERAKVKDVHYIGQFGIEKIDSVIKGYSKSDMINVIGYTNQGKSPFLRYLAYKAIEQKLNVVFIPLETSKKDTERFFYTLHANNYARFGNKVPRITNERVKTGRLNKEEEDYLKEVVEDFNRTDEQGRDLGYLYILQPDGNYCFDSLITDLKRINNTEMTIDMVVMDYISILKPDSKSTYVDRTMINLMNTRMRREMLAFNGGKGFTYIGAAQVQRAGYKKMLEDKEHRYDLTAISDFNSIERDSTLVLSIARTPEDEENRVARIQCLKAREGRKFSDIMVSFDGETGNFFGGNDVMREEDIVTVLEEIEI